VPNAIPIETGKAFRLSVMKKEKRRRRRPAKSPTRRLAFCSEEIR
jgi:hypothetical protein